MACYTCSAAQLEGWSAGAVEAGDHQPAAGRGQVGPMQLVEDPGIRRHFLVEQKEISEITPE